MPNNQLARNGIVPIVPLPPKAETINIRVAAEDLERWRGTADANSMTLSDWIRRTCNATAQDFIISTPAVVVKKSERAKKGGR
jgi:hypothetical protein